MLDHRIVTMTQSQSPQLSFAGFADASGCPAGPSRATWFLVGMLAAWLGPTLMGMSQSMGRRAQREIEK